jgi:ABC-type transport system involved in multi-copper enzyme maturation permease subunit
VKKPVRRPPSRFGNALLGWELLRVSRRTAALAIGRFAFGASLLGVMWLIYSAGFKREEQVVSGDVNQIAKELQRFAEAFSLTFFLVQLTLVFLLTPIFVAGAVFEERETRSGEVLLTTDLSRREVFYGKYLARVVQVMMVVAAGMPVLALTLLWGGVAIEFILIGYAATFFCIFSSGAIAASVAGSSETLRDAVLKSYAYILVFDVLIFPASPYFLIPAASSESVMGLVCGAVFLPVQLIITFVSLAHGLRWLRLAMLRQRRRVTTELATQMARRKPPVADEDPLVWKERYVGGPTELATNTAAMAGIGIMIGVTIIALLASGLPPAGWVAAYAAPVLLLAAAASIGMGAAGGVARERQKNTLIDLFMLPGGRRDILRAKLVGAAWAGRWFLLGLAGLLIVSPLAGTPVVAVPLLALAALAHLAFAGALGLWLSVRSRNALTAHASWMGFVALSLIGTYLLADAMSQRVPMGGSSGATTVTVYPDWSRALNPVMAWQELAMSPDDQPTGHNGMRPWNPRFVPDQTPNLKLPLAGVAVYGSAAALLWWLALRRFEREGREE